MCTDWHTGGGLTNIFHVVLYTILSKVRRGVDRVELGGGLDVRLLKVFLIDPEFVSHLRAQVHWRGRQHSLNPGETKLRLRGPPYAPPEQRFYTHQ